MKLMDYIKQKKGEEPYKKDLNDLGTKYVNNLAVTNALMRTPERTLSGIKRKTFISQSINK
jgi:hypothetical protein